MKTCFASVIFSVIVVGAALWAYPTPAVVQGPGDWTLDVAFDQPRQISVKCPGEQTEKRYWYIVLTLTNKSNVDVPFYPSCDLMTDTFQIVPAGKNVRQAVFEKIKLLHQGKYPFLEYLELAGNKVLQCTDNTKDVAVIWSDFDPKAKNITLFIAGLSNETVAIDHPVVTDEQGNSVKVYLRKTLALTYSIGTDEKLRADANLAYKGKRWVMR
jgi:hypothetical protein